MKALGPKKPSYFGQLALTGALELGRAYSADNVY